jgi:hypothetical protein
MTTTNLLSEYRNGNCIVKIYSDGTKVREYDEDPLPEYPESIDLKITDYCENNCPQCHESSSTDGSCADHENIIGILEGLPKGVEIAVGGGDPTSHPDLLSILYNLKMAGLIANMTVHANQWAKEWGNLNGYMGCDLIHGLGVSYSPILSLCTNFQFHSRCVLHVIAGLNTPEEIKHYDEFRNILILGYKTCGRGARYFPSKFDENMRRLAYFLPGIMQSYKVSFDNLALEQLRVRGLVSDEIWDKYYMGDEGQFTMYIDAVKREYAASSTMKRFPIKDKTVKEMFQYIRTITMKG